MGLFDNPRNMTPSILDRVEKGKGCGSYILDGWAPLIHRLDESIAKIDPDYVIDQIKEKFGGLRYYVDTSEHVSPEQRTQILTLIDNAERLSETTCDVCGLKGKIRNVDDTRYIACRCDIHKDQR